MLALALRSGHTSISLSPQRCLGGSLHTAIELDRTEAPPPQNGGEFARARSQRSRQRAADALSWLGWRAHADDRGYAHSLQRDDGV